MSDLESKIVGDCRKYINDLPQARAIKVHGSQMGNGGEPDIDACVRGRCCKIEVKRPGREPTPRQYSILRKWEAAGALAGYVTSVDELKELLRHVEDPAWRNPDLVRRPSEPM